MHFKTFVDKVMYYDASDKFKEYLNLMISASVQPSGGQDPLFKPTKQAKDILGNTQIYLEGVDVMYSNLFFVGFGFLSPTGNPVTPPANIINEFIAYLTASSQGNYSYTLVSQSLNTIRLQVDALKPQAYLDDGSIATTLGNLLTNPIPT